MTGERLSDQLSHSDFALHTFSHGPYPKVTARAVRGTFANAIDSRLVRDRLQVRQQDRRGGRKIPQGPAEFPLLRVLCSLRTRPCLGSGTARPARGAYWQHHYVGRAPPRVPRARDVVWIRRPRC